MSRFSVDLSGHTAIVTGGGAGIGRAVALALSRCGAAVVVNDLSPDHANQVAQEILNAGGRALGWQADVANRFQAAALIEQARDAYGPIHILVNAAGVYKRGELVQLDEWDWRRVLDVNLTGAFFCTQLVGRVMADEGGGCIVNIASTAGHPDPLPDAVSYIASKSGLLGLTKQAAREYASRGIRVNAVCPANIENADLPRTDLEQIPQGRLGTAEEVANAVLFLCSDAASYITGQAIHVDGGASMV